jgi:hypothetical protein
MLRFSPHAWAKLLYLRDFGDTEVGGFGISRGADLLLIDDVVLVRQTCSAITVEFSDESVADYFEAQVDAGLAPAQFARVWIHTHPGNSPLPSSTDEATFARVFGGSDFAVMFILAREGQTYARLQFNVGPQAAQELAVEVDFAKPFAGADHEAWAQEYLANVEVLAPRDCFWGDEPRLLLADESPPAWREAWHAYNDEAFFLEEPRAYGTH